jgi:hypothetical protein
MRGQRASNFQPIKCVSSMFSSWCGVQSAVKKMRLASTMDKCGSSVRARCSGDGNEGQRELTGWLKASLRVNFLANCSQHP